MDFRQFKTIFIFSLCYLVIVPTAGAYVSGSTNYRIDSDTISIGGTLSTSTNYSLQSSLSAIGAENSTSTNFAIRSGYLQMSTPYLAVSVPSNVTMSSAIYTSGGGASTGSASWNITTDSSGGYSFAISASTNPALKSSDDSFTNYLTHNGGNPSFGWLVGDAEDGFGFSPTGNDIKSIYKDDGTACNSGGSGTLGKCWDFVDIVNKIVAQKGSSNHPIGSLTTINFKTEAGKLVHKRAGSYSATVTATILAL